MKGKKRNLRKEGERERILAAANFNFSLLLEECPFPGFFFF